MWTWNCFYYKNQNKTISGSHLRSQILQNKYLNNQTNSCITLEKLKNMYIDPSRIHLAVTLIFWIHTIFWAFYSCFEWIADLQALIFLEWFSDNLYRTFSFGIILPNWTESLKIAKQIRKLVLLPFADDVWRPKS